MLRFPAPGFQKLFSIFMDLFQNRFPASGFLAGFQKACEFLWFLTLKVVRWI